MVTCKVCINCTFHHRMFFGSIWNLAFIVTYLGHSKTRRRELRPDHSEIHLLSLGLLWDGVCPGFFLQPTSLQFEIWDKKKYISIYIYIYVSRIMINKLYLSWIYIYINMCMKNIYIYMCTLTLFSSRLVLFEHTLMNSQT